MLSSPLGGRRFTSLVLLKAWVGLTHCQPASTLSVHSDRASLQPWDDLDSLTSIPVAPEEAVGVLGIGVGSPHEVESEESITSI